MKKMIELIGMQLSKTKTGYEIWNCFGKGLFQALRLMMFSYVVQLATVGCVMVISIYATYGFGWSEFEEYFYTLPRICTGSLWIILAIIIFVTGGNLINIMRPIKKNCLYCALNMVLPLFLLSKVQISSLHQLFRLLEIYTLKMTQIFIICIPTIITLLLIKNRKKQSAEEEQTTRQFL